MNNQIKRLLCYLLLFSNGLSQINTQTLLSKDNELLTDSNSLIQQESSLTDNSSLITESSLKEKNTLIQDSELISEDKNAVGAYSKIISSSTIESTSNNKEEIFEIIEEGLFVNNYGTYLNTVTSKDPLARHKFVTYFTDWQWSGQKNDFLSYSSERAKKEKRIEICYDNAIKRFGIGTAIIATTWVVSFVVPGGTIVYSTILMITKATTWGALSGAAFDGVISAGKSIYSGHSIDEIVFETIDGASEGYFFGAAAGFVEGTLHVAAITQTTKKIKDLYIIFGEQIYDKSGRLIVNLSGIGKKSIKTTAKLLENQGDDALKALIKVAEKNPQNLSKAIQYMDAKGIDGIYDVLKWKGIIPNRVTKSVIGTAERITKSSLKLSMDNLRKLPGIKLTTKQLDTIRQNPNYLKDLVKEKTGKEFREGYLEFFIRLTKTNPNQANEIWNYSRAVREVIKDAIRPGGIHEWLMCENFMDFLTDPKWRRDGPYLVKILSVLTQDTDNVYLILSDGTKWTHTIEAQMTFGNANNPKAYIHNLIREVIGTSNSAEELLVNLEKMIKENFPKDVYDDFSRALANCFI